MELRKELQEFIAEVSGDTHPGEPNLYRVGHVALEFIDLAGALVRSLDAPNQDADLLKLTAELEEAANLLVDKFLAGNPSRAALAKGVLSLVLPTAVKQAAAYVREPVDEFRTQYLLPIFTFIEQFGHRGRVAFGE
jgi:hypothetical protein